MKILRLAIMTLVVCFPAYAADLPKTLILPTALIGAVLQYLEQRPYGDVARLIGAVRGCIDVQTVGDHGECPDVAAVLAPRDGGK